MVMKKMTVRITFRVVVPLKDVILSDTGNSVDTFALSKDVTEVSNVNIHIWQKGTKFK